MRPILHIHIGLPKTGSTSFQVFAMRGRDWLAQHGLCYPPTLHAPAPTASQHRYLNSAMQAALGPNAGEAARQAGQAALTQLRLDVLASGLPAALISEEQFSYDSAQAARWLRPLSQWADVRIIALFRQPDLWLESIFAQAVRGGYRQSFATFLDDPPTRARLDAEGFLHPWALAFGAESITAMAYRPGAGVIDQMLAHLGLPPWPGSAPERLNPTLPGEAVAYIANMAPLENRLYPGWNLQFARSLAAQCHPAPFVGLTPAARARLLARHLPGVSRVLATHGGDALPSITPRGALAVTPPLVPRRRLAVARALCADAGLPVPRQPFASVTARIAACEAAIADACREAGAIA